MIARNPIARAPRSGHQGPSEVKGRGFPGMRPFLNSGIAAGLNLHGDVFQKTMQALKREGYPCHHRGECPTSSVSFFPYRTGNIFMFAVKPEKFGITQSDLRGLRERPEALFDQHRLKIAAHLRRMIHSQADQLEAGLGPRLPVSLLINPGFFEDKNGAVFFERFYVALYVGRHALDRPTSHLAPLLISFSYRIIPSEVFSAYAKILGTLLPDLQFSLSAHGGSDDDFRQKALQVTPRSGLATGAVTKDFLLPHHLRALRQLQIDFCERCDVLIPHLELIEQNERFFLQLGPKTRPYFLRAHVSNPIDFPEFIPVGAKV